MKTRIDNKDNPAEKCCFVDTDQLFVAGFLGSNHFVIARVETRDFGDPFTEIWLNRKEFDELFNMMVEMKKLMED